MSRSEPAHTVERLLAIADDECIHDQLDVSTVEWAIEEIERLQAIVRKQADRLEDCKRFVGHDRVSVIYEDFEFVSFLAALDAAGPIPERNNA